MGNISPQGREREREEILRLLGTGSGAVVLQGDPGMGKTAMLEFARANATQPDTSGTTGYTGYTVLSCRGCPEESELPHAALTDLMADLPTHLPTDQPGGQPGEQMPRPTDQPGGQVPRPTERLAFNKAVLDHLSARAPVLCLVDDAHTIDAPSLDAIGFAARRLAGRGVVMVIATCDSQGFLGVPRKCLPKLDDATAREILATLRPDLTEPTISAVIDTACGNPGALTELSASATPHAPPRLPRDGQLVRAYRERIERLPDEARWLLLLAAADEDLDTAGLIRAAEASNMDIAALEPAERCGLIRVRRHRVVFPLPLARCVAYESATLARRRAAHALLAKVFDRQPGYYGLRRAWHLAEAACEPDPELARELELAASQGAPTSARASAALERAAQLSPEPVAAASRMIAAARYAWLSGRSGRALSLLSGARQWADLDAQGHSQVLAGEIELRSGAASSTVDHLMTTADSFAVSDRKLAVTALMRAAEAACFSGDYGRFGEILRRASGLRRSGDPAGVELVFKTLEGFGAAFRADHATAAPALRRVVALAWRAGDAASLTASAASSLLLGDDYSAHRAASQGVQDARDRGEVALLPLALEMQACAEFWLGRYAAAEATSWEGVRTAGRSGQDNYAGDHLSMLAVLAAIRGESEVALRRLHELAVPAGAGKLNRPKAYSLWALGVVDLLAGRAEDALARLNSIADSLTGQGHVVVQTMAIPWLVEAAALAGAGEQVRPALRLFRLWVESTGDPTRCALAARCRALLAPRGGDEAERYFTEALRLHVGSECDFERARTQLLYGHRLRRERRPRDAREQLHGAMETFERLEFPVWVERARSELRAAGAVSERLAVSPSETLTAQQLQIARLAAEGATNREIAARLFLSPRTVDHHMRNIFARLGIRSRVELVPLVSRV